MSTTLTNSLQMLRIAWRQSRLKVIVSITLTLVGGAAWPLLAVAMKISTDAAVAHDVGTAMIAGGCVGIAAIGVLVLQHFAYFPYTETAELAVVSLEAELMDLANGSAGLDHHERPEYADRIAVMQRELFQLPDGFVGLFNTLGVAVSLGVTAFLLAMVNPWLLLLPAMAVPPVLAGRRAQAMIDRSRDAAATVTRQSWHLFHLATNAEPAKELRTFRLRSEIAHRYRDRWDAAGQILARWQWRAAAVTAAGHLIFAVSYVAAVLLVLRQAVAGNRPIGDIVLVVILAVQANQQVSNGINLLAQLQRIAQGLTRLQWLRDVVAQSRPPAADRELPSRMRTGIEFHGVDFRYPGTDRTVLSGIHLALPAGATVAIVGDNGAGKTTLVKLLCRFYEPTAGRITLDGVDLHAIDIEQWRSRIAAGFQDFTRFELLARQTVGVGDLPRRNDEAAVRAALDRARSADLIERLPDGLDTPLGTSYRPGTELSGGQWQKLGLGRAMMREYPLLLVLDEPTSALDAETEHRLFEQYAENARRAGAATGAVTVLVSHRFSTVRMADLIVVVGDSRIVEVGDHATLMAAKGLYAELYSLQAAAYRSGSRR